MRYLELLNRMNETETAEIDQRLLRLAATGMSLRQTKGQHQQFSISIASVLRALAPIMFEDIRYWILSG